MAESRHRPVGRGGQRLGPGQRARQEGRQLRDGAPMPRALPGALDNQFPGPGGGGVVRDRMGQSLAAEADEPSVGGLIAAVLRAAGAGP